MPLSLLKVVKLELDNGTYSFLCPETLDGLFQEFAEEGYQRRIIIFKKVFAIALLFEELSGKFQQIKLENK